MSEKHDDDRGSCVRLLEAALCSLSAADRPLHWLDGSTQYVNLPVRTANPPTQREREAVVQGRRGAA